MRYLIGVICVLAVSMASVAQPARAQESLPPQLVLRPSYFCSVDADPVSAQPVSVEPPASEGLVQTEWEEEERRGRNRRIGAAIGVSLAVVAVGVGVGVGMWKAFESKEWVTLD